MSADHSLAERRDRLVQSPTIEAIQRLQTFAATGAPTLGQAEGEALSLLYEGFSGMVLTVCRRVLGSEDDAEDALHDVFIKLPWTIAHYRAAHFGGWLRQVATRVALMRLRRVVETVTDPDLLDGGDAAIADRRTVCDEQSVVVRRALAELPVPLREVVVLRMFLDCSHDEIADYLGISRCASEVRLCRALKRLRPRLQRCLH